MSNFNKKKERKKNTSKRRGNGGELELSKVFCERFPDKKFFRSIGSGNRWSQVDLSEEMKNAFTGDIVCPTNFRFILECKYGYPDIEIFGIVAGHKLIDEWMTKAQRDADSLRKDPMICWRKPHYEWLVLSPTQPKIDWLLEKLKTKPNRMTYNGPNSVQWTIVPLNSVLSMEIDDMFWFKQK